jgi:hypothetical protein
MATAEELKIRLTAQNDASRIVKQLNGDIAKLATTAKASATGTLKAANDISAGFSNVGRRAGMAGIQVQQFVGQIQGGTNPMLALSQQAADLGFVLGAPLAGAVAGIGASLAMVLLPNLFKTNQAIDDLSEDIEKLTDNYKDATVAQRAFAESQTRSKITELKESIFDMTEQMAELEYAIRRDTKLIEQLGTTGSTTAIRASKDLEKNQKEYLRLGAEIDTASQKMRILKENVDFYSGSASKSSEETKKLKAEFTDLKETLQDQIDTFGMSSTQIKRYEILTGDYTKTQKESLLTLLDHIEAQKQQAEVFKGQKEETRGIKEGIDAYRQSVKDMDIESAAAAQRGMKSLEDSIVAVTMGTKSAKDAFKDMATSIIADLVRIQIRQSMVNMFKPSGGGGGGLSFGTFFDGVGELFSFDGGGYTGSGARSGGMDGKGGFPAMLHPNETVIDHTKSTASSTAQPQPVQITYNIQSWDSRDTLMAIQQSAPQIVGIVNEAFNKRGRRGIV